jgi:hypothetical protein
MGGVQEGPLHVVRIDGLADVAEYLSEVGAGPDEVVLVLPREGSQVLGTTDQLVETALGFEGGICVAASAVPTSSTQVATKVADAVARATGWSPVQRASGWRPARAYPYPYGILGPIGPMLDLSADLRRALYQSDADVIAMVLLEGRNPLVLDTATRVFHVLDGTGTDTVVVGGRLHSGGEEPLVVIDPLPGAPDLARVEQELDDPGSRDLARVLRYDNATDGSDEVSIATSEVLISPFWTPEFCATIIRAAESAGTWVVADSHELSSELSLDAISPRLVALLEEDLQNRLWPLVIDHWRNAALAGLNEVVVLRREAGEGVGGLDSSEDLGQLCGSIRLNDGYLGGGLLFPRQNWNNREAPVGSLAIWPDFTHPHRPESVRRGVEYQLSFLWGPARG